MPTTQMAFMGLGAAELIIILVIILLLFGSRKLPQLSRSIGESMREMRKGFSGSDTNKKNEKDNQDKGAASK